MNKPFKSIVLVIAIALIAVGSVYAASAVSIDLAPDNGLSLLPGDDCGGLRMDEFYACQNGGWRPTQAADPITSAGASCDDLTTDKYYACVANRWQLTETAPVLAE